MRHHKRPIVLSRALAATEGVGSAIGSATALAEGQGLIAGDLTFVASTDHASLDNYILYIRAAGSSTTILNNSGNGDSLGKPTPDAHGHILVNIATELGAMADGDYEVTVAAKRGSDITDSAESHPFTVTDGEVQPE